MVVALASTDEELFGAGEVEGEVSPPGGGQVREGHRGGAQHLGAGRVREWCGVVLYGIILP